MPTSAPGSGTEARSGSRSRCVGSNTPRSNVSFEYADESDPGPYPIPANVQIEGGSDAHAILVDRDACKLYELFALTGGAGSGWHAGSGAIWPAHDSNRLRPAGWTSADAAGLPILPGLARYDEVALGRIPHALRFTVSRTRRAYVWPARHFASSLTDPALPPMGLQAAPEGRLRHLRLPAPGPRRPPGAEGVRDDGCGQRLELVHQRRSGSRWSNDDLHTLHGVPGSAFEVVDTSYLIETDE